MKKKKISLRKIILLLMILGCLTSAVAIILTSYSSLQLMNSNNGQKTSDAHFTRVSEVLLCLLALFWLYLRNFDR